ncbi:MAG: response regulator transcription factor [Verrucomicrobia bacterium]|nr:response regulator transcription factor [Verrucomicrobiota bacterium]
MKILVVEDDQHTRRGLVEILSGEGYETVSAGDGKSGLKMFEREDPDFVCLDIMMPDMNGYDLCREIRRLNRAIPVIFISAKSEEIDRVLGLELGADDYIVKPFGVKEVVARIRAVTRRMILDHEKGDQPDAFVMDDLRVEPSELRAYRGRKAIDVSLRDVRILQLLSANAGEVISRDRIFDECWGLDYMPNSRSLDQHISQLRKRVEKDAKKPRIIRTVHGAGYRYDA